MSICLCASALPSAWNQECCRCTDCAFRSICKLHSYGLIWHASLWTKLSCAFLGGMPIFVLEHQLMPVCVVAMRLRPRSRVFERLSMIQHSTIFLCMWASTPHHKLCSTIFLCRWASTRHHKLCWTPSQQSHGLCNFSYQYALFNVLDFSHPKARESSQNEPCINEHLMEGHSWLSSNLNQHSP